MRFTSILRSIANSRALPSTDASLNHSDSVLVLSLLLPSRQETCRFHMNLQTSTVGQLIDEIKQEDSGIEHVHVHDTDGKLLSKSYPINSLMNSAFTIQLNQQKTFLFDAINKLQIKEHTIRQMKVDGPTPEDTVAALYHALNSLRVYHSKYLELKTEANELTTQLQPLEIIKDRIAKICQQHASRCVWLGVAGMAFQVGILAELTWDVYSWDIVEPISYFIAFGTAMVFYSFHLMTRADFEYMAWTDRLFLRRFYREARRQSFDISLYNRLKNRLFLVHTDLARLRSPLSLSLPVPPHPLKCKISGEEVSPLDVYRATRSIEP